MESETAIITGTMQTRLSGMREGVDYFIESEKYKRKRATLRQLLAREYSTGDTVPAGIEPVRRKNRTEGTGSSIRRILACAASGRDIVA
jgi:hypothetical protein